MGGWSPILGPKNVFLLPFSRVFGSQARVYPRQCSRLTIYI